MVKNWNEIHRKEIPQIPMKEVNRHIREEMDLLERHPMASRQYNKALDRLSLLGEIVRRKKGKSAYEKMMKKVIG